MLNKKYESFVYRWQHAHASFDITCSTAFVRTLNFKSSEDMPMTYQMNSCPALLQHSDGRGMVNVFQRDTVHTQHSIVDPGNNKEDWLIDECLLDFSPPGMFKFNHSTRNHGFIKTFIQQATIYLHGSKKWNNSTNINFITKIGSQKINILTLVIFIVNESYK